MLSAFLLAGITIALWLEVLRPSPVPVDPFVRVLTGAYLAAWVWLVWRVIRG